MDKYISVAEFAYHVNRSHNQIYELINKGGCVRKLKAKKIGGRWMIRSSEIEAFPFNLKQAAERLEALNNKEEL